MQFRWVAGITLWTFLSAPVFGPPRATQDTKHRRTAAAEMQRANTGPQRYVRRTAQALSPSLPNHNRAAMPLAGMGK
jgi:hypothetical protein